MPGWWARSQPADGGGTELDDASVATLAGALAPAFRLVGFVTGPIRGVRGRSVAALAGVAPRLRVHDVAGIPGVNDATLVAVAAAGPSLATLRVDDTRVALGAEGGGIPTCMLEPLRGVLTELSARRTALRVVPAAALAGYLRLAVLRIDQCEEVDRELPGALAAAATAGAATAAAAFPALVTLSAFTSMSFGLRGLVPILSGAARLACLSVSETDKDIIPPAPLATAGQPPGGPPRRPAPGRPPGSPPPPGAGRR